MTPAERLIVALDVDSKEKAGQLVEILLPIGVVHFKVGLGLFTAAGPAAVEEVHRRGGKVFLDLKFHDIPNTVAHAVKSAVRLGVWMTNLHIQGGSSMMRQAIQAAREEASHKKLSPPLLVGVTVLTSMAEKDLADLGLRKTLKDQVLYLAKLAQSAGLDGIVASAQEAKVVRWACGDRFLIVTPGIRLTQPDPFKIAAETQSSPLGLSGKEDQQRAATPSEALKGGADYIVVGRPILEAPDPAQAASTILQGLAGRS